MPVFEIVLRSVAGVLLIAANAFFVCIEFALTRLRQYSEDEIPEKGGLRRAWDMTSELEIYLTGCQLGISLTSIVLGVVAEPAVTAMLAPLFELIGVSGSTASVISVVVSIGIIQLVHKIWGEQAPTYLGVERPKQVAKWLAEPLYWWSKVMYPLIIAGDSLAKWTLKLVGVEMTRSWTDVEADDGEAPPAGTPEFRQELLDVLAGGHIGRDRREEIVAAYEIGEQTAREIMVLRDDIIALRVDDSLEENLRKLRESGLTRFPLVGEDLEDYRGGVYLSAVFGQLDELRAGTTTLEVVASEPVSVDENTPVDEVIDILQEAREELAMVLDASGRVVGLVTSTNAFEAIIGELEDPLD